MAERIRHEAGDEIQFAAILDTLDVLIDGSNISAVAPEDAIFLLTRDLLAGCEGLATGTIPRIALPFYESAWEIVIRREGEKALISFYRGGMNPHIEVKDVKVGFADLVDAMVMAGDTLLSRLQDLNPTILADPFASEMMGALERLRALGEAPVMDPGEGPLADVHLALDDPPDADGPLALLYQVTATSGDLLAPTTPNRSDLYSLMAWGTLRCLFQGQEILAAPGRVFFMLESLLLTTRHLLGCMEEQRDLELTQEGESLRIETRYDASADSLSLTLTPLDPARRGMRSSGSPASLSGLSVTELVDAVLATARHFKRQVLDINPTQKTNLKFELLCSEVETLSTWRRDLTASTIVSPQAHCLRYEMPRQTLPRNDRETGRLLGARKLMYSKRWEAEAEGLRLDATFLCGSRLVLCSKNLVAALDRDTGDLQWRGEGISDRSLALPIADSHLVLAQPSGAVQMLDLDSGQTLWTTRIQPSPGKPAGVVAGGGRRPRWAVIATGESGLTAVDLFTGESRWRFTTRRGRPTGFARMGRLVAFTCRSNSVYGLDVDTGDLVWRLSERARFDLPPANLGEMIAVWMSSQGNRAGRILSLDGLTGEVLWTTGVQGRPLVKPVRVGSNVVGALQGPGGVQLTAFSVTDGDVTWTRHIEGLDGPVALLALEGALILHSASGAVFCADARSGEILWSRMLADPRSVEQPLSLEPVLRDGGLFVPLDTTYVLNPTDGALLHRLGPDSPVPDLLRVDENYSIYTAEVSGHVCSYGVVGHLNVVRS